MKLSLFLVLCGLASTPLLAANCDCQGYGPGGYVGGGYSNGYGDFNSPVRDCRGGGKCKNCCKDSTCNMYQHYPYRPDNYGYYYFRPYNYVHVWKHQQYVANVGGDPRNPYTKAMFIPVYEQFENTTYEPDHKPSATLNTLPHIGRELPDLEELIKQPVGDSPMDGEVVPTPAAPPEPNVNE